MDDLLGKGFFPIFAVVAFVAVVLFVEALFLLWNSRRGPEARKIKQRLRALSASADGGAEVSALKLRFLSELPILERALLRIPRIHALDRALLQCGLTWSVATFLLASLLLGIVVYFGLSLANVQLPRALAHFQFPLQASLALAALLLPWAYVRHRLSARLRAIGQQLPDALDLICRALRAGHALDSGLQMTGAEISDPIGMEFRITHDELNYGVSMENALTHLSDRVPSADMRYFVVAVLVQREAGGNLAEVLNNLSTLIRDRLKFQAKVRVLTTEGRMSAWVLGLLPVAMATLLFFANRAFISVLWTDPIGIKITNVLLITMAVGAFWLYRLIQIRA